jgi:hypothetical protein
MILRREQLGKHPSVFRSMTGLTVYAFDRLLPELLAAFSADRRRRLDRPGRRRALGGGDDFDLAVADQFLLTVVWLRHYPTQECLGYLFGVSGSTALRAVRRCLPVLEQFGKDSRRLLDPGKGHRRDLPALLKKTPNVAITRARTKSVVCLPAPLLEASPQVLEVPEASRGMSFMRRLVQEVEAQGPVIRFDLRGGTRATLFCACRLAAATSTMK